MIFVVILLLASSSTAAPAQSVTAVAGAGATFPYPIYAKWFENYRRRMPSVEFRYDAVGSEAGIRRLLQNNVDFGASDSPEVLRELSPNRESDYLFFPSVVGAVVPIVNLPGFGDNISFTPEALAGIYLGKIRKWNDPVLVQANRGHRLPDLDIVVIHRADGSGTSYSWTDYLSKTNSEWKIRAGASVAPKWPVGREAAGNNGVAKLVKEFGGIHRVCRIHLRPAEPSELWKGSQSARRICSRQSREYRRRSHQRHGAQPRFQSLDRGRARPGFVPHCVLHVAGSSREHPR